MNNESINTSTPKKRRLIDKIFGGDKALWAVVMLLLIMSVYIVYSSMGYKSSLSSTEQLIKQLKLIAIGGAIMLGAQFIKYQLYRKWITVGYILCLGLTVLMIAFGTKVGGVARSLPVFGFEFQPFEFLKIAVVLMMANSLAKRQKIINEIAILPTLRLPGWQHDLSGSFRRNWDINSDIIFKHTLPIFTPMLLACLVTMRTSNSTTIIIGASCFIMLFMCRVRYVELGKAIMYAGIAMMVLFAAGGRSDTGSSRLSKFEPNMFVKYTTVDERTGLEMYKNEKETEQSTNAKMSIAMGGLIGRGPGMSTNRSILQKPDSDMAYAFLIEEYGAAGGIIVILAFMLLFIRSIKIFIQCEKAFPCFTVLGLSMIIVIHALLNMVVSTSLGPITGQQLPFISRGGSSLISSMMCIGLILGISRQQERNTLDEEANESFEHK